MQERLADWVLVETRTAGTGPVLLGQAIPGYATFVEAIKVDTPVWYSILSENGDRECGIGHFYAVSNTLTRDDIHATLRGGVFTDRSTGVVQPIHINGKSLVGCTMNAEAWKDLLLFVENNVAVTVDVFGPQDNPPHESELTKGDFWLTNTSPVGVPYTILIDPSTNLIGIMGSPGPRGLKGEQGIPGQTFVVTGVLAEKTQLPTSTTPMTTLATQDGHIWVFDPTSAAASTGGAGNAPAGWVDMGIIGGVKGETGNSYIPSILSFDTLAEAEAYKAAHAGEQFIALVNGTGDIYINVPESSVPWAHLGNFRGPPGAGMIAGGVRGQFLGKVTDDDFSVDWLDATIAMPSGQNTGDILKWDAVNGHWVAQSNSLAGLSGVVVDPTVLGWGVPVYNPNTRETRIVNFLLENLQDVDLANPVEGQIIRYNATTGKWEGASIAGYLPLTGGTIRGALTIDGGVLTVNGYQMQPIVGVDSVPGLPAALAGKANSAHDHNITTLSGYTAFRQEIVTEFNTKAPIFHGHSIDQITDLWNQLNSKAALNHTHDAYQITQLLEAFNATFTYEEDASPPNAGRGNNEDWSRKMLRFSNGFTIQWGWAWASSAAIDIWFKRRFTNPNPTIVLGTEWTQTLVKRAFDTITYKTPDMFRVHHQNAAGGDEMGMTTNWIALGFTA